MKTAFAAASGDVHVRIDDSGNEQFSCSVNPMPGCKRERAAVLYGFDLSSAAAYIFGSDNVRCLDFCLFD